MRSLDSAQHLLDNYTTLSTYVRNHGKSAPTPHVRAYLKESGALEYFGVEPYVKRGTPWPPRRGRGNSLKSRMKAFALREQMAAGKAV